MQFWNEKLREIRKERKLSIDELANLSGVSSNVINNMELGRRGTKEENVQTICATLGIDVDDLYKRDCKIITVLSHKGGTGKTTTASNLGYALSQIDSPQRKNTKLRVLLIDTDAQGNLTQSYNMNIDDTHNFYNAFVRGEPLVDHILHTEYENIDMVVYHDDLIALEHQIITIPFKEARMQRIIKSVVEQGKYDYILIDCHPSLGYINQSIIYGSDYVLVPLIPATFPMRGLQHFAAFMRRIQEEATESHVQMLGIVFNKVDDTQSLNKFIMDTVYKDFIESTYIFKTRIPTDTTIDKAQFFCVPVGAAKSNLGKGRSKYPYTSLAREVVKKTNGKL